MHDSVFAASHRRRTACLGLIAVMLGVAPAAGQEAPQRHDAPGDPKTAVRQVLLEAYVSGVHVERDPQAVLRGFHPDFVMLVNDDGRLVTISLQAWLDHMQLDGVATTDSIRHSFRSVHVTGETAMAVLEIYENDIHIYTDYFSLYRFPEGWRIVGKTYQEHESG